MTLIASAARPRKAITLEMDATGKAVQLEDGSQPGISRTEEQSADVDASWLKKGKKSQFGYCGYLVVDAQTAARAGLTLPPPIRVKCCISKPLRWCGHRGESDICRHRIRKFTQLCRNLLYFIKTGGYKTLKLMPLLKPVLERLIAEHVKHNYEANSRMMA